MNGRSFTIKQVKEVSEFIRTLPESDRKYVYRYIDLLQKTGTYMRYPYCEHVEKEIRALRISGKGGEFRIFYFLYIENVFFLVHAVHKKDPKMKRKDIDLALYRARLIKAGNFISC